jgi:two-component system sensor histidine kinase/response regulator
MIIYLRDQGTGIKDEDLQKIKDSYTLFSTYGTNNENGNGLGLKVSQSLAKIMNGQLLIESQSDKGTTVSLLLPMEKEEQ